MAMHRPGGNAAGTRRTARLAGALMLCGGVLWGTAPPAAAPREPAGAEPRQVTPPAAGLQPAGPAIDGPPAPLPPATITRDARGGATVRAVRLAEPLQLDGVLDEPIYARVEPFGGFIQQAPDEGAPATEATDNWIFFDDESIYVGARVHESVPESEWVANEMQRDSFQLINNDGYIVVLDTFYDRRNGFAFRVNPIGGFSDRQVTDEGNPNPDWNPVWDVRTGRFDGGWTVEMEIPFQSLRFRPGRRPGMGHPVGPGHPLELRGGLSDGGADLGRSGAVPAVGRRQPGGPRGAGGQPHARDQALRDRLAQHGPDGRAADLERRRRERRRRRQVRPDGEPDGGLHLQHRLRAGGGGRAADQPDEVQPVLPGEARVLPREPGHLRLRTGGRLRRLRRIHAGHPQRAARRIPARRRADALLQPAHRPGRGRADGAHRGRRTPDRQGGRLQRRGHQHPDR